MRALVASLQQGKNTERPGKLTLFKNWAHLQRRLKQLHRSSALHLQLYIQADIADLGRLIEAKGGVLAMANQLSAIRYTIRNYGVLVDAISAKPVCGARELSQTPEVEQFMRQFQYGECLTKNIDSHGILSYFGHVKNYF